MAIASRSDVVVGERRIVHARGRVTQTVSICTPENRLGVYETRHRLPIDAEVSTEALLELADLDSVRAFLESHGGVLEEKGRRQAPPDGAAPHNDWLAEATAAVERVLKAALEEFVVHPYVHRVEHSLHAGLFHRLTAEPVLSRHVKLATGETTQLVHKEWPETTPRSTGERSHPRGLFDLAVLSPAQLSAAPLDKFRSGRIAAPIVIEVGLDYGLDHLEGDLAKLQNSAVRVPYLVHFSRVAVRRERVIEIEAFLSTLPAPVRALYAHRDPRTGATRVKHLDESQVSEVPTRRSVAESLPNS